MRKLFFRKDFSPKTATNAMTKIFKPLLLIVIFTVLGYSLYYFTDKFLQNSETNANTLEESGTLTGEVLGTVTNSGAIDIQTEEELLEEEEQSEAAEYKYSLLKDNQLYKQSIEDGDTFFIENRLISALKNYQSAKKVVPTDTTLDIKIGDVYYELKNYKLAFSHYKNNDSVEWFSKQKELLSLFYWHYKLGPDDIEEIKKEISEVKFNETERIYYLNSLQCAIDFSKCKQLFQDYFNLPENQEVELAELQQMKDGIDAYYGSGHDDINFKNALIIGKFFENRHYSMVIKLGNDLLVEFPKYESVIQMVAKSYYELGLYDEANTILKPLHERKLEDEKISYFMGVINLKRKYFLSSAIYFNKALEAGYEPKVDAKRKLVYNYFLIDNEQKMYYVLNDLLYEEEALESDFALGIYQALQDKKYDDALEYAKRGSVNYPESARFYGYIGDVYMRMGKFELAAEAVGKGKRLDPKEISVVYYEGKIFMEEKEYNKAFLAFRRVISLSQGQGEFVSSAKQQLQIISEERNKPKEEL